VQELFGTLTVEHLNLASLRIAITHMDHRRITADDLHLIDLMILLQNFPEEIQRIVRGGSSGLPSTTMAICNQLNKAS